MTDLTEAIADWRENGTLGPWSSSRASKSLEIGPISDLDDQSFGMVLPIADVFGENAKANAALIAAAPDMADRIEALEALLTEIRDLTVEHRDHATMDEAEAVMPWTLWEAVLEDIKEVLGEQE